MTVFSDALLMFVGFFISSKMFQAKKKLMNDIC